MAKRSNKCVDCQWFSRNKDVSTGMGVCLKALPKLFMVNESYWCKKFTAKQEGAERDEREAAN